MRHDTTLLLVYEPEEACRRRLEASSYTPRAVIEISSYLAQSTDIAAELDGLRDACADRGFGFKAVELDEAERVLAAHDPARTMVWTLTDGIAYFRGGASPALARLGGFATVGADDSLFALCQDKFRSGAVLGSLGCPTPASGLMRNGKWLVEPPASPLGWFVKPNRLGAKIGIWPDSRIAGLDAAAELSRRVFQAYRDDVVVQPYAAGRNVRASFLAVEPDAGPEALGIVFVDSGGDFQTMDDSMALYGETGEAAKLSGRFEEPHLTDIAEGQPDADAAIRAIAGRLMQGLGLRDVFSLDFRVAADGSVTLLEFEVCPGLPCFDFRDYCRRVWGLTLAEAMAETASGRFAQAAKRVASAP